VLAGRWRGRLYWSATHRTSRQSGNTAADSPGATKRQVISPEQKVDPERYISQLEVEEEGSGRREVVLDRVSPRSNWKILSPEIAGLPIQSRLFFSVVDNLLELVGPMDGATLIDEKAADLKSIRVRGKTPARISRLKTTARRRPSCSATKTPTGAMPRTSWFPGESQSYEVYRSQ